MRLYHKDFTEHKRIGFIRDHVCSTRDFRCEMILLGPGQGLSPRVHRLKDEVCFLLEGRLDFLIGEKIVTLESGDVLQIERGEIHSVRNDCDRMAQMILISTEMSLSDTVEL